MSNEYQCEEWQALINASIQDLNNQQIRIKILQHPFTCSHKVCREVAEVWKTVVQK